LKRRSINVLDVEAALNSGEEEAFTGGFEKNRRTRQPAEERPGPRRNKTPRRKEAILSLDRIVSAEPQSVIVLPATRSPEKEGIEMKNAVVGTKQSDQIEMRPVWPRIQAVVNQIKDGVQNTETCRVEIHKAEGQTFFTLIPDRQTGIVTVPEGIFPNRWQLTAAFAVRKGLADGVAFIRNGIATSIKSYRTIPQTDKAPALRLYNFARTEGLTIHALTIQIDKDRHCLIREWAISVLDSKSAKRTLEGALINEQLPLNDLERTKKALPATLTPLARELCFLYDRACGKPMPVREVPVPTETAVARV
jgi:hypothetical protein